MHLIGLFIGFSSLFWAHSLEEDSNKSFNKLYPILNEYIREFPRELRNIPEERRYRLNEIVHFLAEQYSGNSAGQVLFITTNEATVGQMASAWSKAAAYYFGFKNFQAYTGGLKPEKITENTIISLEKAGFIVYKSTAIGMDQYRIKYSYNLDPLVSFPKKLDHSRNPSSNYMAVVLDKNADMNISDIRGTYNRLFLDYEDPSGYQDAMVETAKYDETCRRVAVEMFYVFSQLKKRLDHY